jgi:PiT family inorganic phosphate transporter
MNKIESLMRKADTTALASKEKKLNAEIFFHCNHFSTITNGKFSSDEIETTERFLLRKDIVKVTKNCEKLIKGGNLTLSINDIKSLNGEIKATKKLIEYAPSWVIILISVSLGLGTMIGWKRIVKTVGEKIGKQHMSYAQGASAQLVASMGIGMASWMGLPVSTTHMLSSGVAGSMVAKKGLKNLQKKTITSIAMAWVLTLPATMILSGSLFLLFRAIL